MNLKYIVVVVFAAVPRAEGETDELSLLYVFPCFESTSLSSVYVADVFNNGRDLCGSHTLIQSLRLAVRAKRFISYSYIVGKTQAGKNTMGYRFELSAGNNTRS